MADVKIATGKKVKVGSRSAAQGGKYTYEVQSDGSIKNLTTDRTTAPATGKASAPQKAMPAAKAAATSKALTKSTAEKTAPVPKTRPVKMMAARPEGKAAGMPKAKPMSSAAARPEGAASGMPKAKPFTVGGNAVKETTPIRPKGFSTKRYVGPFEKKAKLTTPDPMAKSPTGRPRGFSEKKYSGGIFGLDLIKDK